MTEPQFALWRSPARQVGARAAADQFVAASASRGDLLVGVIVYAMVLVATGTAGLLWAALRS